MMNCMDEMTLQDGDIPTKPIEKKILKDRNMPQITENSEMIKETRMHDHSMLH